MTRHRSVVLVALRLRESKKMLVEVEQRALVCNFEYSLALLVACCALWTAVRVLVECQVERLQYCVFLARLDSWQHLHRRRMNNHLRCP